MCVFSVTQSCPILCSPMDCSLPGYSVHGISQARILEWVAISSYRGSSGPGIEPASPAFAAMAGKFFSTSATWEAPLWLLLLLLLLSCLSRVRLCATP